MSVGHSSNLLPSNETRTAHRNNKLDTPSGIKSSESKSLGGGRGHHTSLDNGWLLLYFYIYIEIYLIYSAFSCFMEILWLIFYFLGANRHAGRRGMVHGSKDLDVSASTTEAKPSKRGPNPYEVS